MWEFYTKGCQTDKAANSQTTSVPKFNIPLLSTVWQPSSVGDVPMVDPTPGRPGLIAIPDEGTFRQGPSSSRTPMSPITPRRKRRFSQEARTTSHRLYVDRAARERRRSVLRVERVLGRSTWNRFCSITDTEGAYVNLEVSVTIS
jgi:hypothetical protein